MSTITDPASAADGPAVRCPICAEPNGARFRCRHVRWTFDRGGPLDFVRSVLESSPYISGRGHKASEISSAWLEAHGEWLVERVLLHFDATEGFVFGRLSDTDMLARTIWQAFRPDTERAKIGRVDPPRLGGYRR